MVHAFGQGIMSGSFSDSLIKNRARTFGEIRRRAAAHITAEEAITVKRESTYTRQVKPREGGRAQPMRVHEAVTEKRLDTRRTPYVSRKNQSWSKAKDDLPFRPKFKNDLQGVAGYARYGRQVVVPPKSDRNLGPRKEIWCEFHKAFGHDVEHCITLGYQLVGRIKDEFLKEYLERSQEGSKEELPLADQRHEVPVHGEINTISGGFSEEGCTASKLKKYVREVMTVETQEPDQPAEPDLCFTNADLRDVVPHEDDPVMISVITVGRRVHRVLIDQRSSTDVMFSVTINKLQLSFDQLRPYSGCLFGFAAD